MNSSYLVSIFDIEEPSLTGIKAFNLQLLSRKGFDVPLTYCITTRAYDYFVKENNLSKLVQDTLNNDQIAIKDKSQKIIALIMDKDFPHKLEVEFTNSDLLNRTDIKWAIRSSSNLEDLSSASFAGLYDSFLGVKGLGNVLNAVKKCWASLWNERAIIYRDKNHLDHAQAKMAVIIQEMVDAKYAGIIFTENQAAENRGSMLLEYCEGLGDCLVSGGFIPYSCKIDKSSKNIYHWKVPERRKFSDREIKNLSKLASKVEKYFGCPQDIEWAFDGKKIYLLQTRPISNPIKLNGTSSKNIWTRANIGEVLPKVITPLSWAVFRATLLNSPDLIFNASKNGKHVDEGIRLFHGRAYIRLNAFLDSFCYLPSVTSEIMSRVLGLELPLAVQSYVPPSGAFVRLAQAAFIVEALGFLPRLSWLAKRLPPPPPGKPERLGDLITWNARCFSLHLKSTAYAIGIFGLLAHLLNRWFPCETESLLPLILLGNENLQTATQGISLWQLAEHTRKNSALRDILETDFDWSIAEQRLASVDGGPQFLTMFQAFLDANGARAAGEFELAVSRWREDPTFVLGVMRRFMNTSQTESLHGESTIRLSRQGAIEQIKTSLGVVQRWAFTRLLASSREFTTLRENIRYRLMEGFALVRQVFMQMGSNLTARGVLDDANDVFFLTPPEVLSLIRGEALARQTTELILERKAQHVRWESRDSPELIGDDGQQLISPHAGELTGIGCSPGTAEGVARVLFDPVEADTLKPGEILIAPHTDPGWTPLFLSCKAVVTEIGGFLSHGATVAREYGIPAVFNLAGATSKIHTGDLIRVNGTDGLVTIVDQANIKTKGSS